MISTLEFHSLLFHLDAIQNVDRDTLLADLFSFFSSIQRGRRRRHRFIPHSELPNSFAIRQ
jgi:hypothetical protein